MVTGYSVLLTILEQELKARTDTKEIDNLGKNFTINKPKLIKQKSVLQQLRTENNHHC